MGCEHISMINCNILYVGDKTTKKKVEHCRDPNQLLPNRTIDDDEGIPSHLHWFVCVCVCVSNLFGLLG